MNSLRLTVIGLMVFGGCVVDKQLSETDGNDDAADGSPGDDDDDGDDGGTQGSVSATGPVGDGGDGDGNPDPSATGPDNPTAGADTLADDPTADDADTADGNDDDPTDGLPTMCDEWAPPPLECEDDGEADAFVDGEPLPIYTDEACIVASILGGDGNTETINLDCGGDVHPLNITTDSPQLPLPFVVDQAVRLTSTESFEPALSGLPSLVIYSPEGDLLLAWVNELDHEVDVPLAPLEYGVGTSGCPGSSVAEKCEGPGSILDHRIALEFGSSRAPEQVFGGHAVTLLNTAPMEIIVEQASMIVCWDDDCIGDDSGPFDRVQFLALAAVE